MPASNAESQQFVQRVAHLPMVALTLSRVTELYQNTKLRHEVISSALGKGEQTVVTSWNVASGIATRTGLQGPLNLADSSACYVLSKVEERLPIITYTPDEIKTMYAMTVQPRVDQLTQMKESTMKRYNNAKDFAVKTVVHVPVQRVNKTVEWSLNQADLLMDKLLPDASDVFPSTYDATGAKAGNFDHVKVTSVKLRQRIAARLADNIQTAQLLAQTFQVVDTLKKSPAAATVHRLLDEIHRLSANMNLGEVSVSNIEERTFALVTGISAQLKEKLEATTHLVTSHLPGPIQTRLHQANEAARDIIFQVGQARNLGELSPSLPSQITTYTTTVQTAMTSILNLLTETYLLKWLIPKYENLGSLDIHIHG